MTRKIVQTGSSLAVTLPKEVVEQFKLKKGDSVDVSDRGKVTSHFNARAKRVLARYDKAFEELAK